MITLNLLHPTTSKPVQTWIFESQEKISIGRSQDNDVVVFSAVVSRYHLELHQQNTDWEIISSGSNGTFYDNQLITQMTVENGMIIRLGDTGPKLSIWLGVLSPEQRGKTVLPKESSSKNPTSAATYKSTYITNPISGE